VKRTIVMTDLFAGVGGIRRGFEVAAEQLGLAVSAPFASEWDKFACRTYAANYGHAPAGDITSEDVRLQLKKSVAEHGLDLLLAGFPCQPFSLAGVSKKNSLGRPHGFKDKTQGTLFHELVQIIDEHQPAAFLLENVKHLVNHDKGRTFEVISEALTELGYAWDYRIINAGLLVPQRRVRVYIVGYRDDLGISPVFHDIEQADVRIGDILHDRGRPPSARDLPYLEPGGLDKYTLTPNLWTYLQNYKRKHERAGNGFGFGLIESMDATTRTLSARYHKDGSEILLAPADPEWRDKGLRPRRLTPRECARLQGFGEDFEFDASDTQAYRQMGNSVAVPVITEVAREMLSALDQSPRFHQTREDLNAT
jgi:DNA (cytosine-5)-methyltransferase 1